MPAEQTCSNTSATTTPLLLPLVYTAICYQGSSGSILPIVSQSVSDDNKNTYYCDHSTYYCYHYYWSHTLSVSIALPCLVLVALSAPRHIQAISASRTAPAGYTIV